MKKFVILILLVLSLLLFRTYFKEVVWIVLVLESCIVMYIIFTIIKGVIYLNRTSEQESLGFTEKMRTVLEKKFGKSILLEFVLTELNVFYYSLFVWFIKKPVVKPQGEFSYHRNSEMKTFIIVFSILIIGEGILFHFLLQKWNVIIAWIFTVVNIYGLLYLVGFYNSAKYLPHVKKDGKLTIRLGFQSSIEVEWDNIKQIKPAKEIELGMKMPKNIYYSLLKLDTPHYEISLKEPVELRGAYGINKKVDKVVFRADEPDKMIEGINIPAY